MVTRSEQVHVFKPIRSLYYRLWVLPEDLRGFCGEWIKLRTISKIMPSKEGAGSPEFEYCDVLSLKIAQFFAANSPIGLNNARFENVETLLESRFHESDE